MKSLKSWLTSRNAVIIIAMVVFGLLALLTIYKETPRGSITGRVVRKDTGKPIEGAKVYHPGRSTYVKTDAFGYYTLYGVPAGDRRVDVFAPGFHDAYRDKVAVTEGKTARDVNFSLIRRDSSYSVYSYQKVFQPREDAVVNIRGYLVKNIKIEVYKLDFIKHINDVTTYDMVGKVDVSGMRPVHQMTFTAGLNEDGEFEDTLVIPVTRNGLYLVKTKAVGGKMTQTTWFSRSDIGMVVKRSPQELLVYSQSFTTGKPMEGINVRVYRSGDSGMESAPLTTGTTDKNGLYTFKYPTSRENRKTFKIIANKNDDYTISNTYQSGTPQNGKIYLYTERPVYRPGQVVYFKGIARERVEDSYNVLRNRSVTVKITDTGGTSIYNKTLTTNEFGSFNDTLQLGNNPPLGTYNIMASVVGRDEDTYASFQVSEYKKPEYKVEITTDKPHYIAQDKISIKVKGTYYFGAPVKGAEYRVVIFESPYYWGGVGWDDYFYPDNSYGGVLYETSGTLDENGEALVVLPTGKVEYSQMLNIESEVTDLSGRAVTANKGVTLTSGEFALYAYTDSYVVTPNQDTNLKINARDFEQNPVKSQQVSVSFKRITYEEVAEKTSIGGRMVTEYRMQPKEISYGSAQQVTTDNRGDASLTFKPVEPGTYSFDLTAKDTRGNTVKYNGNLYVSSSGSGGMFSEADLKIITDKKQYKRGDKVKAVITSSKPNTYALLTIEGRHIYETRVLYLEKGSLTLELPMKTSYFPNVFLSVTAIKDMHLVSDEREIKFNRDDKKLNIAIKPDKKKYAPGEKAKFTVTVTDSKGKPVRTELSMGVVDEAIYAIAPDNTPDVQEFFWNYEYNYVDTAYSFSRDYSGGADKDRPAKIRKNFKDTAAWSPTVVTDENGVATVEFVMPDNLTTWVSTVRCVSDTTLVGSAVNFVISTKDLLVRLETPRFLTQRDKLYISGIVHNYTEKDQNVKVWLEAKGVKLAKTGKTEDVIKPNDAKDYYWEVEAIDPGTATFTLLCKGTTAEDAMELELPVLPYGVEEVKAENGQLYRDPESTIVTMDLPDQVNEKATSMEVSLSPSLAGTLFGNLDYLVSYPYGCVEQTMSSFAPAIMASKAFAQLNLNDTKLQKQLPDVVSKGLNRLYNFQHDDGGWGWWEHDETHPIMTAYVVMGLHEARQNGYNISTYTLDRGLAALKNMVKQPVGPTKTYGDSYQEGEDWNTRAYLLYALNKTGNNMPDKNRQAFDNRKHMNTYAKALMALTLASSGDRERADAILRELDSSINMKDKAIGYFWNGRTYDYSWMDNNIETTAYCLQAYMALRPDDEKIPYIIRWLVNQRVGARYSSTKDTAAVVYAFVDYLRVSKELTPGYQLKVDLNEKSMVNQQVGTAQLAPEVAELLFDSAKLKTGANNLKLDKNGPGALYYTARMRYFPTTENIPALSQGFTVERSYKLLDFKKSADGTFKDVENPLPAGPLARGSKLRVTVTITPDQDYRFILIEDPLPAGFEVMMDEEDKNWGSLWWCRQEVHDEKISFFSRNIKKGKKMTLTYDIRAEMSGEVKVLPTSVYCMYSPEVRGHSSDTTLKVDLKH